jgi:tRNA(Ile)-lysidine synthase
MHSLGERAASWRTAMDTFASRYVSEDSGDGVIRVAREGLATYDSTTLCVLWPAIAARAHVTLDRRGTLRLAQFTISGAPGARIQLSGGVEVYRHRDSFVVRPMPEHSERGELALRGVVQFGEWTFSPVGSTSDGLPETPDEGSRVRQQNDAWVSDLPADRRLSIRAWQPADRMRVRAAGAARRVKRFFGDANVPGPRRMGWPVVVADDEIVWIPGVRRTDAASARSGRPVIRYACERFDGNVPRS